MSVFLNLAQKIRDAYWKLCEKFHAMVEKIRSLNPAYKQPGDGSDGTCDCIGLIIGAIRRMGLKWTGIHGSNYAARYQTVDLEYITSPDDLEKDDVVSAPCTAAFPWESSCFTSVWRTGN